MEIKLTQSKVRSLIKKRDKNSHKGDYGHVLVIAGSLGMTGAAVLASGGALRSGAGLVTVATAKSQEPVVAKKLRPEAMTLPVGETKQKSISLKAFGKISNFIKKRRISSIVLGPGLGTDSQTVLFVKKIISVIELPVVLDADGINCLKDKNRKNSFYVPELRNAKAKIILTPHPGELSGLTGIPTKVINKNRAAVAKSFAEKNNIVCVLKGHETVITDGNLVFINTTGNSGMATGGSGDVLSGMIAALIKQVKPLELLNASVCGVFLHGLAGDVAKKDKTEISLIATDIIEKIPQAIKKVINGR